MKKFLLLLMSFIGKYIDPGTIDMMQNNWDEKVKEVDSRIMKEQSDYGDLLILPLTDVYSNLSLKLSLFLKWCVFLILF